MGIKLKIFKIAIGLMFILGFFYMLYNINWVDAYDLFVSSKKLFLILSAFFMFASILVKIYRFKLATQYYHHPISFKDAALIQMIGISIAMVTPGRVGEASKIFLLKKQDIPLNKSISIMIFERLFDLFILMASAIVFAFFVVKDARLNVLLMLMILIALFVLFLLRKPHIFCKLIPKRFEHFKKHVLNVHFSGGCRKVFLLIVLSTILTWFLESSVQWIFAIGMGIYVNPFYIFGILGLSTLIALLSFLPAGIGAMDFSVLFLFSSIGITPEAAISLLLVARVFGTLFPMLIAFFLIKYWKVPLKEIRHSVSITKALDSLEGNDDESLEK